MRYDLHDFRVFSNIAEEKNLTRGAARSYLSVPAASQRIKHLEEALGLKLLLRSPQGFELQPDEHRRSFVNDWLEEHLQPVMDKLDKRLRHFYGFDFARSGDLSIFLPVAERSNLVLAAPFLLELRNVPFRQQEQILYWCVDRLPRFSGGKHDARGNGQFLAEYAIQKYGPLRIEAVMPSQAWYLANMPVMKAAFEDRTFEIPRDADVKSDFRQIRTVRGVPLVPDNAHTRGVDGGQRHGDAAIAGCLAIAAAKGEVMEFGYRSAVTERGGLDRTDDDEARDWWNSPLGAGLRGGL
ncbi:MAG: LysR family transcriptional regulator [Rhizobiales bacterium]|nr:LysR family transcriptional regulator [Hyphomicrobiales bacterium]